MKRIVLSQGRKKESQQIFSTILAFYSIKSTDSKSMYTFKQLISHIVSAFTERLSFIVILQEKALVQKGFFRVLPYAHPNPLIYFCPNQIALFVRSLFFRLTFIFFLCSVGVHGQYRPADFSSLPNQVTQFNDGYRNVNVMTSQDGNRFWLSKSAHPSNTNGIKDLDIWESEYVNGEWSELTNDVRGLNSSKYDIVVGSSVQGFLYVLRYKHGTENNLSKIGVYRATSDGYVQDHVIELPAMNIKGRFFAFHVNVDETAIVMSMQGEYSFGSEDLYVILKGKDGKWQAPLNLGARINSSEFEMSPFMSKDNRHLYFSSEGHGGMGKADVFVSVRLDDTWKNWSKPMNLGPNVNSDQFEAYFVLNEPREEAYFYSVRGTSQGQIFRTGYNTSGNLDVTPHKTASGFVRFEKLPAINVKLDLVDENDRVVQTVTTDENGYFNLQAFVPNRDYKLEIEEKVREDLMDAEIFLTNDLGERMVYINEDELGIFGFSVLSGEKVDDIATFENAASSGKIVDKPTQIKGKIASYGTVNERVRLKIVDEDNQVVETIETDEEGYFAFNTQAQEKSYFLSIDQNLEGLVDVYEIFLTNENPEEDIVVTKTDKHLFEFKTLNTKKRMGMALLLEEDFGMPEYIFERYGMVPASKEEQISGFLTYDKLPLIDAEVVLIDENDMVLASSITDSEGGFYFDSELLAGNYELKLSEGQERELARSEIYLARNPSDVLVYLNDDRAGVFAFKKLARSKSMTLYSLRSETEKGNVVNSTATSLKGKFHYAQLPQDGIALHLMDDSDNIVQEVQVDEDGNFEIQNYSVNKNYFISVETEGLSDIYEIYLSGTQKNVLVNRTDKYVFSFKVLEDQEILLTESFEVDPMLSPVIDPSRASSTDKPLKRAYFEYDIDRIKAQDYTALNNVVTKSSLGHRVVVRLYREQGSDERRVELSTITIDDVEPVIQKLTSQGIRRDRIMVRPNGRDQMLLFISN